MISRCMAKKEKLKSEKLDMVNKVGMAKNQSKRGWQNKKFRSHALMNIGKLMIRPW